MTESNRSAFAVDRTVARRDFLKTAAWAGAAISAAGIGGFGIAVSQAQAVHEEYVEVGPVAILQFAYQLELLEGTFYAEGVNAGLFAEPDLAQIVALRDHEMAHADFLAGGIQAAGGEVPATPTFTFPDGVFTDPVAFLELAATFEPVGVGAYQGAAPALIGSEFLAPALSIHNAEAQHVVGLNVLQGVVPPANTAFTEALALSDVQAAVAPFGL